MTPTCRICPPQGGFALPWRYGSMGYLIVFIGGGIGASLRHGFNIAFARLLGTAFPYSTLFENVSGAVVMGILVAIFAFRSGIPHHRQLFLPAGILGGYTTFSTFS